MNATHAAAFRAMSEARQAFMAKWAGQWEVTAWPTDIGEDDSDEPHLHAWSGAGLEGWPEGIHGHEWDAEVRLALAEDPGVLIMAAHLYLWRPNAPVTTLVVLPERSVAHDEAPSAAQALVREITTTLDRLLYSHAEPV